MSTFRIRPAPGILLLLAAIGCTTGPAPTGTTVGSSPADDVAAIDRLLAEGVGDVVPLEVRLAPDALLPEPTSGRSGPLRVGTSAVVDRPVRLAHLDAADLASGAVVDAELGGVKALGSGFVWGGAVEVPGASAVRLQLEDLYLPRQAELWVYDTFGEVHGPFVGRGPDGDGTLWTPTLRGERVDIQIRYTGTDTDRALDAVGFTLAEVGGIGTGFALAVPPEARAEAGLCDQNASCVMSADGAVIPAEVAPARDAVALMLYQSGRGYYICSGGLLSDTAGSGTPYFLTANHCISRGREAKSLETFFQYATDTGDSCDFPTSAHTPRVLGASLLASDRIGDFTLLELSRSPGGTTTSLPWSAEDVAYADGTTLYRISHPSGSPQAWSIHEVDTTYGTCSSWPRGSWIYSGDVFGATEGGSSGSPVLNASGEVVGQLSGGCGTNVGDVCDNVSNATVDGNLSSYVGAVASWLDPADPPSCVPVAEDCSNGIDDDCDGDVDGADSDCATPEPPGTCDLGLAGDACDADAECCSGNCKGKPGRRTCK